MLKLKDNHELRMSYAKLLAVTNAVANEAGADTDELVGFECNETYIIHPFMDEQMEEEVDPIEYYGQDFIDSQFYSPEGGRLV